MIKVPAELTDEDISANKEIRVRIRYGAREESLVKSQTQTFELKIIQGIYSKTTLLIVLYVAIFIMFLLIKRKKKKRA